MKRNAHYTEFDRDYEQQEKCSSSRMITIQLGGEGEDGGRRESELGRRTLVSESRRHSDP